MLVIESSFIKPYSCDGFAFDVIEYLKYKGFPYNLGNRSCIESLFTRKIGLYHLHKVYKNDYKLVINPVIHLDYYGVDTRTIVYTMWDTTTLPVKYVNILNDSLLVIVPSEETKNVFKYSGVTTPIEVIRHGYDPKYMFKRDNLKEYITDTPTFTFGTSGQVVSPQNDKKDIQRIIGCFREGFYAGEDVRLNIKITDASYIPDTFGDSRIIIQKGEYDDEQMGNWYRDLSCYINVSKYESFGRQPLEAMACGIPVISPMHSGLSEYIKRKDHKFIYDSAFILPYTKINANCPPYMEGYWYETNRQQLINYMRYVYSNRKQAYEKGIHGYSYVNDNRLDMYNGLEQLYDILVPYSEW